LEIELFNCLAGCSRDNISSSSTELLQDSIDLWTEIVGLFLLRLAWFPA